VGYRIIGILLLTTLAALLFECWALLHSVRQVAQVTQFSVIAAVGIPILAFFAFRIAKVRKPFARLVSGLVLGTVGWAVAGFHLWLFDPAFLAHGRVKSKPFSAPERGASWLRPLLVLVALTMCVIFNPATLGYVAQLRGDFQSARDHWSDVLRVLGSPEAYLERARSYAALKAYSDAISDYNQAAVRIANPIPVYAERALASTEAGDYSSAVADCDRVPSDAIEPRIRKACDEARAMAGQRPAASLGG
jgi:hypothetical protein